MQSIRILALRLIFRIHADAVDPSIGGAKFNPVSASPTDRPGLPEIRVSDSGVPTDRPSRGAARGPAVADRPTRRAYGAAKILRDSTFLRVFEQFRGIKWLRQSFFTLGMCMRGLESTLRPLLERCLLSYRPTDPLRPRTAASGGADRPTGF